SRLTQTVEKLNRRGVPVRVKKLVKVECDHAQLSYQINRKALEKLARRLKLPVARTELRARAAWRTAITRNLPLILLDERDRSTREAQTDVHQLARELWPRVSFPSASEIKVTRRAGMARSRRAA